MCFWRANIPAAVPDSPDFICCSTALFNSLRNAGLKFKKKMKIFVCIFMICNIFKDFVEVFIETELSENQPVLIKYSLDKWLIEKKKYLWRIFWTWRSLSSTLTVPSSDLFNPAICESWCKARSFQFVFTLSRKSRIYQVN